MKPNQLKLPGATLATVLLLGAAGCHSNGMPSNSNTADTTNVKKPDTINASGTNTTAHSTKRRMDTVRK